MKSFKRFAYKIGSFEDENNPPTVNGSSAAYDSGIFTFNTTHFTNNFQDADGDSYNIVRIESLPYVGSLTFSGNPIQKGYSFSMQDVGNLTFELPSNIMVSSSGFCEFNDSINDIITQYEQDGYDLKKKSDGKLVFEKEGTSSVPNDADIYAFLDATSMAISDAEAAQTALTEWYNTFTTENTSFTGNLYIIPIVKENWLDFPNIILRGSSDRVRNNADRPDDDFMSLAVLPPNFDTTSNDDNPNWTAPAKVVTLAFIDEVADGTEAYHRDRNGYGFSGQPFTQYLTDYKNFRDNYSNFTFFKGILYPIPDIESGSYNNIGNAMVLQGFAAIEGGATYKLAEIESLGVTYAKERRFHWHLDPEHTYYTGTSTTVANPYSKEANTAVPNSSYILEGLRNFGWAGIYDKDQPASEVFTSDTFSTDLNKYFQGTTIEVIDTEVIEGNCVPSGDICFDFRVSDDSQKLLLSNTASFCLTGADSNIQEAHAPTVSSNSVSYGTGPYVFSISDFTNNFQDEDGDTYNQVKILSQVSTSKNISLSGLTYNSLTVTPPQVIEKADIGLLQFEMTGNFVPVQDRIYKFDSPLSTQISDLESQGYSLLDHQGGVLEFYKLNTSAPESPITSTIKGNDIGNLSVNLNFKISDSSTDNLFSNTAQVYLDLTNNNTAPVVGNSTDVMNTNDYSFTNTHFTTGFSDAEGNGAKSIRIDSIIQGVFGKMTFKGYELVAPFSFDISEVSNLKYTVSNRFVFETGGIYSFEKDVDVIISEQQALGYTLVSNSQGVMTFEKVSGSDVDYNYVVGNTVTTKQYCLDFKISDNSTAPLFSNQASVCIDIPETETPIDFNYPPTVGDNTIEL